MSIYHTLNYTLHPSLLPTKLHLYLPLVGFTVWLYYKVNYSSYIAIGLDEGKLSVINRKNQKHISLSKIKLVKIIPKNSVGSKIIEIYSNSKKVLTIADKRLDNPEDYACIKEYLTNNSQKFDYQIIQA